jgi:uncharacterized membrane protein YphA (DoxX/SURF4 family)
MEGAPMRAAPLSAPPELEIGTGRPAALVVSTATALRLAIAAVWIRAALPKLERPAGSAAAVRAFQLFPEWLVRTIGYGLPFLGAGLALLLTVGLATRLAATVSAVVIATFAVGVAAAAARGLDIRCGFLDAGGTLPFGQPAPYVTEIVRDDSLLLALGFLVWAGSGRCALDNWIRRRVPEPVAGPVGDDVGGHWRATELLAERRREADWRSRATSAACLGALAGLVAAGCAIQAARLR